MKLTDFLQDVGRPVAYYPHLRKITGSTNATILLCQFIYWLGKQSDPDGWLYKTSDEIEDETGLSYEEQKVARKKLVENGLLEEHYARLDHQMKFILLIDAINGKWGNDESHVPEQGFATMPNKDLPRSLTESTSYTSSQTTPKNYDDEDDFEKPVKRPKIYDLYEHEIGNITPMVAERLKDAEKEYPENFIEIAFEQAASHNARNFAYVEAILKSLKANGIGGNKKPPSDRPGPKQKPGMDSTEIDEYLAELIAKGK